MNINHKNTTILVVIAVVASVMLAATMVAFALPSLLSSANAALIQFQFPPVQPNTLNPFTPQSSIPQTSGLNQFQFTPVQPNTLNPSNPTSQPSAQSNSASGAATAAATNTNTFTARFNPSNTNTNTNTNTNINQPSQSIQAIQSNPIQCNGGTVINNQCTCGIGTHLNAAGNGCDPNIPTPAPTPAPVPTSCSQTNPACPSGQICLNDGTCGTPTCSPMAGQGVSVFGTCPIGQACAHHFGHLGALLTCG